MGIADVIVVLVGSGTTLREKFFKKFNGFFILESQVTPLVFFFSNNDNIYMLGMTHEMLERLEANLMANGFLMFMMRWFALISVFSC
ncbi:unnamed protein product [Coffea canephora]|uniref:Uncharacterized protein n=1 Tax=Coffea canephora TaxID=49390 RepID=A0A068VKE3_COFCA|nr:unnamed protein product [Coffea canephora]